MVATGMETLESESSLPAVVKPHLEVVKSNGMSAAPADEARTPEPVAPTPEADSADGADDRADGDASEDLLSVKRLNDREPGEEHSASPEEEDPTYNDYLDIPAFCASKLIK